MTRSLIIAVVVGMISGFGLAELFGYWTYRRKKQLFLNEIFNVGSAIKTVYNQHKNEIELSSVPLAEFFDDDKGHKSPHKFE